MVDILCSLKKRLQVIGIVLIRQRGFYQITGRAKVSIVWRLTNEYYLRLLCNQEFFAVFLTPSDGWDIEIEYYLESAEESGSWHIALSRLSHLKQGKVPIKGDRHYLFMPSRHLNCDYSICLSLIWLTSLQALTCIIPNPTICPTNYPDSGRSSKEEM